MRGTGSESGDSERSRTMAESDTSETQAGAAPEPPIPSLPAQHWTLGDGGRRSS
jgi:hypothetical protein